MRTTLRLIFCLWVALAIPSFSAASEQALTIENITRDADDLLITVDVPAGLKKVTLLGRSRLDGSAWEPRAVARLDGNGGTVVFRLPNSDKLELLRVRGDATELLPASAFTGTNSFVASVSNGGTTNDMVNGPVTSVPDAEAREVVESDIYKLVGDTLYLFNQMRGLQVINVTNPDSPQITGTFPKAGVGEDLYTLPNGDAVLLARNGCYYGNGGSEALVVGVTNGSTQLKARVEIEGTIAESRMVGSALYVAATSYRTITNNGAVSYHVGTVVTAIDLSNATAPVVRDELWYAGSGHAVYATDTHLFVCLQSYDGTWGHRSDIQVIDISAPDGAMKKYGSVQPYGMVADKFKMNFNDGTLTVVSHRWGAKTEVETFSFDGAAPTKLGSLTVIEREQLHGVRFDGDTLYVVTFMQVDPLWVIDLADPRQPRIVGELEVPGWSTYIHPMGDRLLALGIDNSNGWRVALSLFNVTDKAKPTLESKVTLDQYSWSEGNHNEKAFKVIEEQGLILLPYTGSDGSNHFNRVRLVDFTRDALTLRGFIEHEVQARRAFLHKGRALSVSGRELVTVNIENRDLPVVTSELVLSWPVDRVLTHGDYLLEVEQGGSSPAKIRVAAKATPESALTTVTFTNDLQVVGATIRSNRLYVAMSAQSYGYWGYPEPAPELMGGVELSVFGLDQLPALPLRNVAHAEASTNSSAVGALQPLWPRADLLVWVGAGQRYGIYMMSDMVARPGFGMPWWGGSGARELIAFEVTNGDAPKFVSRVNFTNDHWHTQGERSFATNGLVYLSHAQTHQYVIGTNVVETKVDWRSVTNYYPITHYEQRYYLDVIDFENAAAPLVRRPVNIPGELVGVSHGGEAIYTTGQRYTTNYQANHVWLDALAYDGAAAYLIDSVQLDPWNSRVAFDGSATLAVARVATTNSPPRIETYQLDITAGKLALRDTEGAPEMYSLVKINGAFAGAAQDAVRVWTVDLSGQLTLRNRGEINQCIWGFDAEKSAVDEAFDLWAPMGDYGVSHFPALSPK